MGSVAWVIVFKWCHPFPIDSRGGSGSLADQKHSSLSITGVSKPLGTLPCGI